MRDLRKAVYYRQTILHNFHATSQFRSPFLNPKEAESLSNPKSPLFNQLQRDYVQGGCLLVGVTM